VKKVFFIIGIFSFVVSIVNATPDRQRYVLDKLIGLNGQNMIVLQVVYDNLQQHDNQLVEVYLIEKYMENGNTKIIYMYRINEQDSLEELLLQKYNKNLTYVFPDIFCDRQEIFKNGYIETGREERRKKYLKDYIPKELINCTIIGIGDIYFINEYIYLTVDMEDNINNYRKIIMIKRWHEE
jgi:hypothetical protein